MCEPPVIKGQGGSIGTAGSGWPLIFWVGPLFCLLSFGCQQREKDEPMALPVGNVESVALCRDSTALLPLMLAERQGFFRDQGLTVAARDFTVGRDALETLLKGECELATAAEPPVIEYAMQRDDFRIVSALQSTDNQNRLVARVDQGIKSPSDLRGKRIATVRGTSFHYFLELFLEKHDIKADARTILFMKSDELLAAFSSGQVDAIAINNKVISQAQKTLGDKVVVMEDPGLCYNYTMILATRSLLDQRPTVAVKFLRALAQADDFIVQRPDETAAIAQGYLEVMAAEIRQLMGFYHYQLSLDQAMLIGLEGTARWYIQQSDDRRRSIPNFINLINSESLRSVRPDAINLDK